MLVDDSALFRQGLALLLETVGFTVHAQARTPDEAVARFLQARPQLVILDIRMPPTDTDEGLTAALRLRALDSGVGILLLSAHVEPALAERLMDEVGDRTGYLLKDRVDDIEVLRGAIERIVRDETVIDPEVVGELFRHRRNAEALAALTDRERAVLALMAEGRSNSGIAGELAIAVKTVEANAARIFGKLGLGAGDRELGENRRVRAVLTWLRANPLGR